MLSLQRLLQRVSRPTQIIVPWYRRYTLIPHVVIGLSMFWGSLFDVGNFTNPVFKPIFEWADVKVWGFLYLVAGISSLVAILNNSWKMYFAGNIATLALSLLWMAALIDARFHLGYDVSSPAFGLWGFVVSACIVLAAIPIRVIRTR